MISTLLEFIGIKNIYQTYNMKKYILLLFLLFSFNTFAQEADKTVSITVSGSGKTQDEAKQSAMRSAIEQTFGAFISSKTEILNDQIVADQMSSVSSGNIQSFKILAELQFPDGSWGITLNAIVSVSKLTNFVEAKGITVDIKGGLFAINIKQQMLNEQSELKAVSQMIGLLHETMLQSFDYEIKSGEPKSIDNINKQWIIPLEVTVKANKNFVFCEKFMLKTLESICLSKEERKNYEKLNKEVFPVYINFNVFYFRNKSSLNSIEGFANKWPLYVTKFYVSSESGIINGSNFYSYGDHGKDYGEYNIFEQGNNYLKKNTKIYKFYDKHANYINQGYQLVENLIGYNIRFFKSGKIAAVFQWNDIRTLSEIEKMTKYNIQPN
jgi:hypothetical protein